MSIINTAKSRYATKKFDTNFTLTDAQKADLKELLRLSPSSINIQPWHFLLLESDSAKELLAKGAVGQYSYNAGKITDSTLTVVFCVKTDIDTQHLDQVVEAEDAVGRFANAEIKQGRIDVTNTYVNLHKETLKDLDRWTEKQVYINLGNFLLGVKALGLDACPIEGLDWTIVNQEFALAEKGLKALVCVTVGKAHAEDFNAKLAKGRLALADIITTM